MPRDTDPELLAILPDPTVGYSAYEQAVILAVHEYGVQTILEEYASGILQSAIAKRVGITGSALWRYFNRYGAVKQGPEEARRCTERAFRWAEAKKFHADSLADSAVQIADDAPETAVGVQKARLQSDIRRWRASVTDPETFGQKPQGVTINLDAAFLDSLKAAALRRLPRQTPERIPDADYVLLPPSPDPSGDAPSGGA